MSLFARRNAAGLNRIFTDCASLLLCKLAMTTSSWQQTLRHMQSRIDGEGARKGS